MRMHVLTHVPFEGPAGIAAWAHARGHSLTQTLVSSGDGWPDLAGFDWLAVMGGPMGVQDTADYPWLVAEKRYIHDAIAAGKTVIGVCLGAQLIAAALGARVYRNPQKEIGWFPIEFTAAGQASAIVGHLAPRIQVFHWHGDTFDLPSGAVQLARSEVCEQQVFLYDGRVLGLQCHLESTPQSVADIVVHCADELRPAAFVQSAERLLATSAHDYAQLQDALFGILDRLPDADAQP